MTWATGQGWLASSKGPRDRFFNWLLATCETQWSSRGRLQRALDDAMPGAKETHDTAVETDQLGSMVEELQLQLLEQL